MKVTTTIPKNPNEATLFYIGVLKPGCSMEQLFRALSKHLLPKLEGEIPHYHRQNWTNIVDRLTRNGTIVNMSQSRVRCLHLKAGIKLTAVVKITTEVSQAA